MSGNKPKIGKYESRHNKFMYELWWWFWSNSLAYVLWMRKYKTSILLTLRFILNIYNFKPTSHIRFLYFDTTYENCYQKTVCNMFLYIYILTIWRNRKENLRIGILKSIITKKIVDHLNFIKVLQKSKLDEIFKIFQY